MPSQRIGVLVTRPAHQAEAQAGALTRRGYTPILAPCLKIKIERGPSLDDDGVAAYAVTSANGVAALAQRMKGRDKTLYVVGAATEAAARTAGFTAIERGTGDGPALATLIAERFDRASGALLYACGEDTAFDLQKALQKHTILVLQVALYAMPLVASLPVSALKAMDAGEAKAVLLMSARTATAFGDLAAGAGRHAALRALTAICLSEQVAKAARDHDFARIAVAAEPNEASLLAALETALPVR